VRGAAEASAARVIVASPTAAVTVHRTTAILCGFGLQGARRLPFTLRGPVVRGALED
jgi:hypothetical protein